MCKIILSCKCASIADALLWITLHHSIQKDGTAANTLCAAYLLRFSFLLSGEQTSTRNLRIMLPKYPTVGRDCKAAVGILALPDGVRVLSARAKAREEIV